MSKTVEKNVGVEDDSLSSTAKTLNVIRPYGYSVSKCGYCKGARSNFLQTYEPMTTHQVAHNNSSQVSPPVGSTSTPTSISTSTSKSSKLSSKSYSVVADSVSPALYEALIQGGWRRSGVHLYKPQNFSSCCPTLTLRLLTREFKPNKSQRKVLRKMDNILKEGETATRMMSVRSSSTPKKQKRNHRETQKLNTIEGNLSNSNEKACGSSSLVEAVLANGILRKLEEATSKAVDTYFSSVSKKNFGTEPFQQGEGNFALKTSYRILPPSKRERKQLKIRAVSPICAQISGRFQTSRDELAQHLIRLIRKDEVISPFQKKKDKSSITNSSNHSSAVSIASLESHPPSGQIICTIQIEEQDQNDEKHRRNEKNESKSSNQRNSTDEVQMNGSQKTESNDFNNNCGIKDGKLARWCKKTTGKNLHLESNKNFISIDTLPAHQSALQPDVHKLYVHYQHVVHDDPDRFSDVPNAVSINTDNSDNSDEDDEELKLDTDDPSELDWGHAPTYFTENISSMLTSYTRQIQSKETRRSVLSSYYSFYQFLVEAPFPLHPPSNGQTMYVNYSEEQKQQLPKKSCNENDESRLPCGLYHQHYRLGGDFLIAVGVIDVLPTGLSSVYLFYHPSFAHELVALGKYAILKEIEFARDTLKVPYYYLGYYIESCQKMRYKADYHPTQILCPKFYEWVDSATAIAKLQMTPHNVCALIEATPQCDEKKDADKNVSEVKELTNVDIGEDSLNRLQMDIGAGVNVTIDMLQASGADVVRPILEEFILEFSPKLSEKCVLKLT
mmetsp:Transcript_9487/g.23045  ORF Transcript_9487/g.23045 Transcript_9487/m.23045 type:complete len:785 (-) Transcript_9487:200-2554(-)